MAKQAGAAMTSERAKQPEKLCVCVCVCLFDKVCVYPCVHMFVCFYDCLCMCGFVSLFVCVCVLQSYEYYTLRVTLSKQIRLCGEGNCNKIITILSILMLHFLLMLFSSFLFFFLGHHDYEVGSNEILPTGHRGNILTSDGGQIDLIGKL